MIPRNLRRLYYTLLSPMMRINAARHRMLPLALKTTRRAHLGPGRRNYLPGWINVDANMLSCRPDIWADLRFTLPFRDSSLDAIYSHHVIEHLPNLDFHFREMFRCLRSGGVIRVGGPNGDSAIVAMQAGDLAWFGDWPTMRRSAGGRFENFIFCKGEHLTILTASFLRELCEDAGFVDIRTVSAGVTRAAAFFGPEVLSKEPTSHHDLPETIMVEATRP